VWNLLEPFLALVFVLVLARVGIFAIAYYAKQRMLASDAFSPDEVVMMSSSFGNSKHTSSGNNSNSSGVNSRNGSRHNNNSSSSSSSHGDYEEIGDVGYMGSDRHLVEKDPFI
jgi:hypothetical protein